MVLNQVEQGEITGEQAAELMGLGLRQVRGLLASYRKEGGAALAHGNRGRRPVRALSEEIRNQVVALAQGRYAGFNHHHLTELLAEREGLAMSRSSVWRILTTAGLRSSRHRRPAKHRRRPERYPQEGMLLQIDGSQHDWLEGRGPYLTLVAAMDDASGKVAGALFREEEDAQGYFLLLRGIICGQGIPLALYSDRHGIFQRSIKEAETLEEQLSGERQPTQFGRALKELGIQPIFALSPQAKGRIERLFGTLQDRLVAELRLARTGTIEVANRVLEDFLPRFNTPFRCSGISIREYLPSATPRVGSGRRPLLQIPAYSSRGQHHTVCWAYTSTAAWAGTSQLCSCQSRGTGAAGWESGGLLPRSDHRHRSGTGPSGEAACTQDCPGWVTHNTQEVRSTRLSEHMRS